MRNTFLIVLFYGALALSLLTAFSSNQYLPGGDIQFHTANITEAKIALEQHQFPIRVSPHMHQGLGYAHFQFYGPAVYLLGGLLNHVITNPFVVYKLMIWLALVIGGIFMCRLTSNLVSYQSLGILAGVVYLTSPYVLINLTSRQDFTETIAQGLLPFAIYYSAKLFEKYTLKNFLWTAVAWAIIAMTHLITFAYGLGFLCLFFIVISIYHLRYWRNAFRFFGAAAVGILLAGWYLAPILFVSADFIIRRSLGTPFAFNYLTTLSALFSLKPMSPIPVFNGSAISGEGYMSIGIPLLIGFGICVWICCAEDIFVQRHSLMKLLLLFFVILFFVVWSPIDFWQYLPSQLVILQFSYRLLTELMLCGSILFAYAMLWLFQSPLSPRAFIIVLTLILIANRPWLHSMRGQEDFTIESLPNVITQSKVEDYMVRPELFSPILNVKTTSCVNTHSYKNCYFLNYDNVTDGILPILYYPHLLKVEINAKPVNYFPVTYQNKVFVGVKLFPGENKIMEQFVGLPWANALSGIAWVSVIFLGLWQVFKRKQLS